MRLCRIGFSTDVCRLERSRPYDDVEKTEAFRGDAASRARTASGMSLSRVLVSRFTVKVSGSGAKSVSLCGVRERAPRQKTVSMASVNDENGESCI